MALSNNEFISFQSYLELNQNTDLLLEYIDGLVYMSPSPSTQHQRTSMKLSLEYLFNN